MHLLSIAIIYDILDSTYSLLLLKLSGTGLTILLLALTLLQKCLGHENLLMGRDGTVIEGQYSLSRKIYRKVRRAKELQLTRHSRTGAKTRRMFLIDEMVKNH